ncbi:MAG TPA: histidine kinase [Ktedonosporobacter sp.]|jgi:signal transduction histidine kinase|nr:histidine kinase [Ktedonosporobacter sp.]
MASIPLKVFKAGVVRHGLVLQLLLCHSLIVLVAIISGGQWLFVLGACLLSFLLLLNIPYNFYTLEIMLARLARNMPVEPDALRLHWPLAYLFTFVKMIDQQSGQQIQVELRNNTYRDQLLQQVSRAAAQEERNRLARDLHDSIKQQIFSIAVSAAAARARWEDNLASVRQLIENIERTAQEAQVEMQALLQQLRPGALENIGLLESLRLQCQALSYRTGVQITTELGALPADELLPVGTQEMIFRIVQEGFANIARHARATQVWLSIQRQGDALLLEIGDNGQGFELAQANEHPGSYGGMGLSNVRERVEELGGTLSLWSMPDHGTTLHLCIPLVKPELQTREHTNHELTSAVRKTRSTLRVGMYSIELAAAFILLYTPVAVALWLVGLCLIVALISWLWAQQYRFQISLHVGRQQEQHLLLLAQSYYLLASILLLIMFYAGYLLFAFHNERLQPGLFSTWITLSFLIAWIIAIGLAYIEYARNLNRHSKVLSHAALQEQVQRQLQQIIVDWIVWLVMFGLAIIYLNVFSVIPADELLREMSFAILAIWLLALLMKSFRVIQWQRRLSVLNEGAGQDQKGGVV